MRGAVLVGNGRSAGDDEDGLRVRPVIDGEPARLALPDTGGLCGVVVLKKWVVVDERSVRRLRRSDGRKGGCGWNGDVVEVTSGCVVRARGVEIERG